MNEPDDALNELTSAVIGAAIAVHRQLGPGYLDAVYEEALCIELEARGIRFGRQVPVSLEYRGRPVGEMRLDIVIEHKLIVELKAVDALAPIHSAQLISYLRATGRKLGILINFNVTALKNGIKRVVATQ
jgi:GxxExxY protein